MRKSHTFFKFGIATLSLYLASTLMWAQGSNQNLPLFDSNASPQTVEVTGTFEMEILWTGSTSKINSLVWDNHRAGANNGSAYLSIYNAEGSKMWSGYPSELPNNQHEFQSDGVLFQTGHSYVLSFDLTQSDVAVYTNTSFPWKPRSGGPVDILGTELTGMIDQPIDPDGTFPFFALNMEYGVGLEEMANDNWSVYPNPAVNWIALPAGQFSGFELIAIDGSTLAKSTVSNNQDRVQFNVPPGLYIVRLTNRDGQSVQRRLTVNY